MRDFMLRQIDRVGPDTTPSPAPLSTRAQAYAFE
jgi:hypothetical protein